MSALTPSQIRRRDEALARCEAVVAAASREMAELYQDGGAEAVAEAAYCPGGPGKEEIAADYERLVRDALDRQRASGEAA